MKRRFVGVALELLVVTLGLASLAAGPASAGTMRTVKVTPQNVARGKMLFTVCVVCHGPEGGGQPGKAASLAAKTFLEAASDEMMIQAVLEGRSGTVMAPWKVVLTRPQVEALVAFLRDKTPTKPAKLDESPLRGDPDKGAKVFERSCALCHDPSGDDYRQWGTAVLQKGFAEQTTVGYLRYIIKRGKTNTAMQSFKGKIPLPEMDLTDQQIEDVIAHVRLNRR